MCGLYHSKRQFSDSAENPKKICVYDEVLHPEEQRSLQPTEPTAFQPKTWWGDISFSMWNSSLDGTELLGKSAAGSLMSHLTNISTEATSDPNLTAGWDLNPDRPKLVLHQTDQKKKDPP